MFKCVDIVILQKLKCAKMVKVESEVLSTRRLVHDVILALYQAYDNQEQSHSKA